MVHSKSLRGTIVAIAIFLAGGLYVSAAHAQQHACNGTPGERILWVQPPSNGLGQVYWCVVDEPPPPPPQYQDAESGLFDGRGEETQSGRSNKKPKVENFLAIVTHPETTQPWIAKNYRTAREGEQAALAVCRQMMKSGCEIFGAESNKWFTIGHNSDGAVVVAGGQSNDEAEKSLQDACATNKNVCTITHRINFTGANAAQEPEVIAPTGNFRKIYAAVAWPDDKAPARWATMVWAKGGFASQRDAEGAVTSLCARESGTNCVAIRSAGFGALTIAVDNKKDARANSGSSVTAAPREQLDRCTSLGLTCVVTLAYDVKRTDVVRQDYLAEAYRLSGGKFGVAAKAPTPAPAATPTPRPAKRK